MAANTQNTTKIIDLKIKGAETLDTIDKLSKELEEQREIIKRLNAEKKTEAGLSKEQRDEMQLATATSKQLQKELTAQQNVLKNGAAESRAATGSLKELRAQYNTLKVTYEELSEAQREALIPQMKEIKDRIEEADKAVGNYSTSVGNYEDAITNALPGFGKFQQVIKGLGIDASATAKVMAQNVVMALKAVGNSMKALMANPLIVGIAGILAVILAIKEAINNNQQAMDALQRVFAPFKVIVDAFFKGLGAIIGTITEGIAKFIEFIVPANGYLKDSIDAQKTLQELREAEIADIEETAAGNRRIAELKDNIAAKDKFTAEQRRKFAEEVKREIEVQMKGEEERANLRLRAFEQENAAAIKLGQLTADERREYAELKAAIDNVKAANLTRAKEATAVVAETTAAIEAEKKAVQTAEAAKRKEYADTSRRRRELEQSIDKQLEELANTFISDQQQREIADIETRAKNQSDAIKKQLATDKDLTKAAREDLNAILILLERRKNADIEAVNQRFKDAEFQAELERIEREAAQKAELQAGTDAYEAQRQMDEAALKLERRRQELADEFLLEQELAQQENDMLLGLDEAAKDKMFETQEAYELAVLKSNERVARSNSELRKTEIEKAQEILYGVGSVAGGLSDLFGQLAGKSKAMQGFQKSLGLAQIASDMAVGIAGAIKAGAGVPFPGNLAAIASGVTSVVAGITSAIATLKGGQDVQVPSELQSGMGGVQTSSPAISVAAPAIPSPNYTTTTLNLGTSDTSASVASSNQANDIKAAIKEAYQEMPAPVVKVSDIQSVTTSSENIKNISVI